MKKKIDLPQPDPMPDPMPLSNDDVIEGMRKLGGYYSITPNDFRDLYVQVFDFAKKRILTKTKAAEIMSSPVLSIRPYEKLRQAIKLMGSKNISGLPVVDNNEKVIGVLSEKDIIRQIDIENNTNPMSVFDKILKAKTPCLKSISELTVAHAMSSPAIFARNDTSLLEIIKTFQDNKINRVPVLDEESRLLGIISRNDLLDAYSLFL